MSPTPGLTVGPDHLRDDERGMLGRLSAKGAARIRAEGRALRDIETLLSRLAERRAAAAYLAETLTTERQRTTDADMARHTALDVAGVATLVEAPDLVLARIGLLAADRDDAREEIKTLLAERARHDLDVNEWSRQAAEYDKAIRRLVDEKFALIDGTPTSPRVGDRVTAENVVMPEGAAVAWSEGGGTWTAICIAPDQWRTQVGSFGRGEDIVRCGAFIAFLPEVPRE